MYPVGEYIKLPDTFWADPTFKGHPQIWVLGWRDPPGGSLLKHENRKEVGGVTMEGREDHQTQDLVRGRSAPGRFSKHFRSIPDGHRVDNTIATSFKTIPKYHY